jgi:hypothetical protein
VLIDGAVVDGSCASFRGVGNMQPGDQCRADGAAIALALMDGKRSVVENSSIRGEGGCLVVGSGGGSDALLVLRNNTLEGRARWDDPGRLTCGYYLYESKGHVEDAGNRIEHVRASDTMRDICERQQPGSLMDNACVRLREVYRSLRDAAAHR